MAGIYQGIYAAVIRRNYVFVSTIFLGAFAGELLFSTGSNAVWDQINKGRQWKDIKHRYMDSEEE